MGEYAFRPIETTTDAGKTVEINLHGESNNFRAIQSHYILRTKFHAFPYSHYFKQCLAKKHLAIIGRNNGFDNVYVNVSIIHPRRQVINETDFAT
ncbi:MAG: hypothetical protein DHS20C01_20020 [marine bacterium B5-7]|nr:MAG: hypothetical protein DHS20C01_20020 [marine bacterium B5-7]